MDRIITATCDAYETDEQTLLSRTRGTRRNAHARALAMWLCRETGETLIAIGQRFGREHSTVHSAVKRVDDLRKSRKLGIAAATKARLTQIKVLAGW